MSDGTVVNKITFRDECAMRAMQALVMNDAMSASQFVAMRAYEYADAMLKQRKHQAASRYGKKKQ